jgi:catechol 2,3-dioxygenase-like lactoylglutathione lyase family enzyme
MLSAAHVMTFIATKDSARSRAFYEDLLGLTFVADEEYALVFDLNGTMLRIQKVQEVAPSQYTSLGWSVPDIAASVRQLEQRGIKREHYGEWMQQDELGIWTSPAGAKIAWFKDPDGHTLSLTQF